MKKNKNRHYSEIKKFGIVFTPINWVICLIVTLVLYLCVNKDWAFYYMLGSLTSFMTFALHMKEANDYGSEKANATMRLFTNVGVRITLSGLMLAIAYFLPGKNIACLLSAFIGMIVLKVVLVIFVIVTESINLAKNKKNELVVEETTLSEGGEDTL